MSQVVLKVEGMSCSHCENRVKKAVGALAGVTGVDVSLGEKTVTVELDAAQVTEAAIRETIDKAGYDVVS